MSSLATPPPETNIPPTAYSLEEVGQSVFDMGIRFAGLDKQLTHQQFEFEAFARRQDANTKRIEDRLALLIESNLHRKGDQPEPPGTEPAKRGWRIPPSLTQLPNGVEAELVQRVKPEAPRFTGEHAVDWIRDIQKYYNHHFTPLHDRLYLTSFLFDHPAKSWLTYWEDNCKHKSWEQFLLDVKHRFDPDMYVDHVGCLAELRQTATVEAY